MKSNLKHQLQWLFSFSHYKQWHMNIRYMHNWECIEFDSFKNFIWNNTWSFSYYVITNDNLRSEASHVLQVRSFTFDSKQTYKKYICHLHKKLLFVWESLCWQVLYAWSETKLYPKMWKWGINETKFNVFFEYYINIPGQGIVLKQDQKSTRCDY